MNTKDKQMIMESLKPMLDDLFADIFNMLEKYITEAIRDIEWGRNMIKDVEERNNEKKEKEKT